jgi:hypothetical protein
MRLLDELRALVRGIVDREARYGRLYAATVAKVHDDGSYDVIPDDATIRGNGHRVEVTHGTAGWVGDPEVGDRCLLGFDGADPSRPFALGARKRTSTRAVFDGGTKAVARVDDTVSLGSVVAVQSIAPAAVGVPPVPAVLTWYAPGQEAAAAAAAVAGTVPGVTVGSVLALGPGVVATGNGKLLA